MLKFMGKGQKKVKENQTNKKIKYVNERHKNGLYSDAELTEKDKQSKLYDDYLNVRGIPNCKQFLQNKKDLPQWGQIELEKVTKKMQERNHNQYNNPKQAMREYHRDYYNTHKQAIRKYHRDYYNIHKQEYHRDYYNIHKQAIREYHRDYYNIHKQERKEYYNTHKQEIKDYRNAHKEEIKNYGKDYRNAHKEEMKDYRNAHKEEIKVYMKDYKNAHKEVCRQHTRKRYNRIIENIKKIRDGKIDELSNKQLLSVQNLMKGYHKAKFINNFHGLNLGDKDDNDIYKPENLEAFKDFLKSQVGLDTVSQIDFNELNNMPFDFNAIGDEEKFDNSYFNNDSMPNENHQQDNNDQPINTQKEQPIDKYGFPTYGHNASGPINNKLFALNNAHDFNEQSI